MVSALDYSVKGCDAWDARIRWIVPNAGVWLSSDGDIGKASGAKAPAEDGAAAPSRRQVLRIGALTAGAVLTVRPAVAQAAASVMNCQIPVPDIPKASEAIGADGAIVPAGTAGSFPGGRNFTGEQVKAALKGGSLPGTTYEQNRAYLNYIRRLQAGRSGFTCYASLQMPR